MAVDGIGKSVKLDILIEKHTGLTAVLACSYTGCFRRNSKYFRRW
jgi:hypothetical protein